MKYIDAEKLIAEIRKLRSESCISESDDYYEYAKCDIIDIIDSLRQEQQEQPEVDIEKEAKECWDYIFPMGWDKNSRMVIIYEEFIAFARHFCNLGLNARKED